MDMVDKCDGHKDCPNSDLDEAVSVCSKFKRHFPLMMELNYFHVTCICNSAGFTCNIHKLP